MIGAFEKWPGTSRQAAAESPTLNEDTGSFRWGDIRDLTVSGHRIHWDDRVPGNGLKVTATEVKSFIPHPDSIASSVGYNDATAPQVADGTETLTAAYGYVGSIYDMRKAAPR